MQHLKNKKKREKLLNYFTLFSCTGVSQKWELWEWRGSAGNPGQQCKCDSAVLWFLTRPEFSGATAWAEPRVDGQLRLLAEEKQIHAKLSPSPLIWPKAAEPVGAARWEGGGQRSVGKSLAGLFPAAGGAPHVAVLHPVHLAALLPFTAHLPTEEGRRTDETVVTEKTVHYTSQGRRLHLFPIVMLNSASRRPSEAMSRTGIRRAIKLLI